VSPGIDGGPKQVEAIGGGLVFGIARLHARLNQNRARRHSTGRDRD
jgi:hypothetical protein